MGLVNKERAYVNSIGRVKTAVSIPENTARANYYRIGLLWIASAYSRLGVATHAKSSSVTMTALAMAHAKAMVSAYVAVGIMDRTAVLSLLGSQMPHLLYLPDDLFIHILSINY